MKGEIAIILTNINGIRTNRTNKVTHSVAGPYIATTQISPELNSLGWFYIIGQINHNNTPLNPQQRLIIY